MHFRPGRCPSEHVLHVCTFNNCVENHQRLADAQYWTTFPVFLFQWCSKLSTNASGVGPWNHFPDRDAGLAGLKQKVLLCSILATEAPASNEAAARSLPQGLHCSTGSTNTLFLALWSVPVGAPLRSARSGSGAQTRLSPERVPRIPWRHKALCANVLRA